MMGTFTTKGKPFQIYPLLLGSYPGKTLDRNPLALLWRVGDGKEARFLVQAFTIMFFFLALSERDHGRWREGGVDGRFHIYLFDHRFSLALWSRRTYRVQGRLVMVNSVWMGILFSLSIFGVFAAFFALDILFMCLLTIVLWLFPDGLLCSERSVDTGEKHSGGCCILCVCVGGAALL